MIYSYDVVFKFILTTIYLYFTVSKFILHNVYSYEVIYTKIKYSIFDSYLRNVAYDFKVWMMWV